MSTIQSKDYDGYTNTLVYKSGLPVHEGDFVETAKGEWWQVVGGRAPHKPSSTGKVHVEAPESSAEFYPSVIGAKWVRPDELLID